MDMQEDPGKWVDLALERMGFPKLPVTNIKKPEFTVFIDDRAVRMNGPETWEALMDDWIYTIKPWRKS